MHLSEFDAHRATVDTASGRISYVEVGSGPPALFVHGVATAGCLWRHVVSALAGQRRCIALDLPLHGHSPAAPDQDLSLLGLARAVEDFCAALELTDVDLVANDTGGAVAQIVAAHAPERLRSLTLTNCDTRGNMPPWAFVPTLVVARLGLLAPLAPRLAGDVRRARRRIYGLGYEDVHAVPDDVVRAFVEPVIGSPARARAFQRCLTSLHDRDLRGVEHLLARLEVPTLLVWGTGDVFFATRWAYWLRDLIPGAERVVELEGARLFFPDERAGELVPALREHWAAARPPVSGPGRGTSG